MTRPLSTVPRDHATVEESVLKGPLMANSGHFEGQRIRSALPPKADIRTAVEKGLLMTLSGHSLD